MEWHWVREEAAVAACVVGMTPPVPSDPHPTYLQSHKENNANQNQPHVSVSGLDSGLW